MPTGDHGDILLISDLHSHYHVIEAQVAHATETRGRVPDRVLVLGDFGLFAPNLHDYFRRDGNSFSVPVAFIEGNHEDFRAFEDLVREYADSVTHLQRGSVHDFGLGQWLFIGGARYMDSWSTPPGCEIREHDVARCLGNPPGSIDVVLSHDCPADIGMVSNPELGHLGVPGDSGLTRIATHLRPRRWFFGHHHRWFDAEIDGTRYVGLPQSWQGYVLLNRQLETLRVDNEVPLPRRPRWWRWIGLG